MIGSRLLRAAESVLEYRATLNDPNEAWLDLMQSGSRSLSGVTVNPETALNLAVAAACVQRVSTSIAMLPMTIVRRTGPRSRERVHDHAYAPFLQASPNPEQTAFEFFEQWIGYAMLWPEAVVYVDRRPGPGGNPLWALRPDRVKQHRVKDGPNKGMLLGYDVVVDINTGESRFVKLDDCIVLRSAGYTTKTPIQRAREVLGLGLAAQEFGNRFFGQGASMAGWVQVPTGATKAEVDALEANLASKHQGLTRSHLIGMLTGGAEWKEVGMPLKDAQFLEGRRFTVEEVCRFYGVPPHKVGHLDRATFSNIEQQNIEYVTDCLGGWMRRAEMAVRVRLFPPPRGGYGRVGDTWPEFLAEALLRGDTLTRYAAYALGIQWGFLTRQEARDRENLNELDHLDEPLQPLNMVVAGTQPADVAPADAARALEPGADTLAHAVALLMARNGNGAGHEPHSGLADPAPTLPA